jgi:hypothetical protein
MTAEEKNIISLYTNSKLSEQQIADHLPASPYKVRWVIQKYKVPKRNVSEAIRYLNITKHKKEPFVLRKILTSEEKELKISGIMLCWGEGTKEHGKVVLHNSDPAMIALFARFLREICGVHEDRLRVTLHLYPDQDASALKRYWSTITGVPVSQFHAPRFQGELQKEITIWYGSIGIFRFSPSGSIKWLD